jgi:hypothetical protein
MKTKIHSKTDKTIIKCNNLKTRWETRWEIIKIKIRCMLEVMVIKETTRCNSLNTNLNNNNSNSKTNSNNQYSLNTD